MRFPEPAYAEHDFGSIKVQQSAPERVSVMLEDCLRFAKSGQRISELALLSERDACKHDCLCLFVGHVQFRKPGRCRLCQQEGVVRKPELDVDFRFIQIAKRYMAQAALLLEQKAYIAIHSKSLT